MALVRIVKSWPRPDLMRQTPGGKGIWDGFQFTLEPIEKCDYLIVLNRPSQDTTVQCPPQHVWAVMQEPPSGQLALMHRGDRSYRRVYTSDDTLQGQRYIQSQPALPWHVNRDYDFLVQCGIPEKRRTLSWITSNAAVLQGHRDRLGFLDQIRDKLEFDLYGKGIRYIEDKWDGLAPYRYSLAVENFSNPYYWSEKLADCFLAWAMPIYYGCTRISAYFPSEAMVCIDIHDPLAIDKIRETVSSDLWRRNLDAIAQARRLVLDRYQLFPLVAKEIRHHESNGCMGAHLPQVVSVPCQPRLPLTASEKMRQLARSYVPQRARRVAAELARLFGA